MKEITSLHVKPFHPENYSTIYDYDSYLDYAARRNNIFLDHKRLKNTYGVKSKSKSSIPPKVKFHNPDIQILFSFR